MTLADIQADVLEYADFEEKRDVSRAAKYITAANRWLQICPESSSNQGSSLSIGKQHVADTIKRARAFVAQNTTGSGGQVRFLGPGVAFR